MFEFRIYEKSQEALWDSFIETAKNGHFMFKRKFMEYHSDRFLDHSLMIYQDKKLISVLPAHKKDHILASHLGLSFAGLVVDKSMKLYKMLELLRALLVYLKSLGFKELMYKAVPQHYQIFFSNEDAYALSLLGARIIRRDASSVIDLKHQIGFEKGRRGCIKKALGANLEFSHSTPLNEYFHLIESLLKDKYASKPVHSLDEMKILQSRFPENIKLYTANKDQELLAGIWVFLNNNVIKTQYIASTEEGRKLGAVDFIVNELINNLYKNYDYFDFGSSVDNSADGFNPSLMAQKEMFGARTILCDWYQLNID